MLCEKCGKQVATTHIKTVIGGVVREYNLCSECAAEEGYNDISKNGLAGMLASMFGDIKGLNSSYEGVRCSVCNSKFSDIASSGKVGCAECYKTFKTELLPYLKRVHGSTKHAGKIPNNAPLMVKNEVQTKEDLKLELNRLVSEEKYEQAAVIRDKIKEMEEKENE